LSARGQLLLALLLLAALPAIGQQSAPADVTPAEAGDARAPAAPPLWPDAAYDAAIPTLRDVLGHDAGDRIVSPEEALEYLEALEEAAPARLRLVEYGRTWEDRPLVYAVVASERNLARLDAIRDGMAMLTDPRRTSAAEADRLIDDLPAVVWLAYGIHGDEISSTDAALQTAYHLLAARDDELVATALANTVVILDAAQNPDGRARFVHHHRGAVGREPSAHPLAAERDQPWPGGRTNHYHFDLNRDLLAITQPETRARVRAESEWRPLVFVDFHEMGSESTYFFPPTADPANPHITPSQMAALDLFGRNNAKWFDRFGFDYYTREIFDFFFPGYNDTWGTFHGGIGMTYEQASARGLVVRRPDGSLLTYRDGVRRHFVASVATIETAARNRERLLRDLWAYRSSAIEEGRRGAVREHVLPWRGDTSLVQELADLLSEHGVELRRSKREVTACGQRLPAGSFFVSTAQPAGRLARTLLERQVDMDETFLREQERRRRKSLPHEMYDVTAWSLPLLYGVEHLTCGDPVPSGALEPAERSTAGFRARALAPIASSLASTRADLGAGPGATASGTAQTSSGAGGGGDDALAWVVPWGTAAAVRFVTAALARDLEVLGADEGFTLAGRAFPRGSLIVKGGAAAAGRSSLVRELAEASGAEIVPTSSTWVDAGVNFGSDRVLRLRRPEIALAWGEPTHPNAAGAARWVLERRHGLAVTTLRAPRIAEADLSAFDVIVLPDGGGYAAALGEAGARNLERFVQEGGVLVAFAGAVSYLAGDEVGLLAVEEEKRASSPSPEPAAATPADDAEEPRASSSGTAHDTPEGDPEDAAEASPEPAPGTVLAGEADYLAAIAAEEAPPDEVPGVIARAVPDPDHWLTVGVPDVLHVMVQGSAIFSPLRLDQGVNAVRFADAGDLLASGYLWEENRRQLAWKPFVVVEQRGRGLVIGFVADPTFRGVLAGADVLLSNAIVRAPAHVVAAP
jgi:hypothetical protein